MTGNGSHSIITNQKDPEKIRILSLSGVPYEDNKRIRVEIILSPFQDQPCIDLVLTDPLTKQVMSRAQVIDSMLDHLNLTLHLRIQTTNKAFELYARVYYPEAGTVAEKTIPVSLQDD